MRIRIALAMICLLAGAVAAEPLPKDADEAHCKRGWDARILAWNRATMVDAYRTGGAKDERWDAAAERCLDHWAAFFSGGQGATAADLLSEADHVLAAGCVDPLVIYLSGRGRQMLGRPVEAEPILHRSESAFAAHPYPALRLAMCRRRLVECRFSMARIDPRTATPDALAPFDALVDATIAAEVAALADRAYVGMERLLYEHLDDNQFPVPAWQERREAALERACRGAGVDPWFAKTWLGRREIQLAWQARGSGFADTVTDDGWKGFEAHLGEARTLLDAAARLKPEDPIAPTQMITVTMAGGGDLRAWFDRAVRAQFDYAPAYSGLRYALMPRWSGSHEQMLALGDECLATARFDTEVPWQYAQTVEEIIGWDHAKDPKTVLGWPTVNEKLHRVFDGYRAQAEKAGDAKLAAWQRSLGVAADYGAGRVAEAAKERAALGPAFSPRAFDRFRLDWREAQGEVEAPPPAERPDF